MQVSELLSLFKSHKSSTSFTPFKPFFLLALMLTVGAATGWIATVSGSAQSKERTLSLSKFEPQQSHNHSPLELSDPGAFLFSYRDGERVCEEAPLSVATQLASRNVVVSRINHSREADAITQQQPAPLAGLKIVLRGTQQLEGFPEAKQSFLRAAAIWERIIATPISIVVDVDFGPNNFGVPFANDNIIGSTRSQVVGSNDGYADVRSELGARAQAPAQPSVIKRLPPNQLPTDSGAKAGVVAPTALFRALGLIRPIADPDAEEGEFGKPPAIGFNSAITFDFNASDGIEATKLDFEAAALHEIGHALGFYSSVGVSASVRPSIWDFFRLRPDVDLAAFGSAERILTAGGMQAFLAGRAPLALSTGNPQASNGDRRQASHWKDDALSGVYIGIMDPTGRAGDHDEITENDLYALATFGYRIRSVDSVPTTELLADDGGIDTGVAGAGVIIVNRLTPSSYPARLEAIRLHFSQFKDLPDPSGSAIRIVAFAGPAGATSPPSSPVLLVDRLEAVPNISVAGDFIDFKIQNGPVLNEGDFYVGFQAPEPAGGVIFSLDDDEPKNGRSFYSLNDGRTFQGLTVGTPPVTYNAMIRALVSIYRGMRVESSIGRPGEAVSVPITLLSKGNERSAAFSLDFNPDVLALDNIESGESGVTLQTVGSGTSGHFGITAIAPENQTFASGQRRLAIARFRINSNASPGLSPVTLGDQPTVRKILGTGNNDLTESAAFTGANLVIAGKIVGASAASFIPDVLALDSMAVAFGVNFSVGEARPDSLPLPYGLAGTTVRIRDSASQEHLAPLFYVSGSQTNFHLPPGPALGPATLEISSLDGNISRGAIQIEKIAPGLFSANSTGRDVASGYLLRVRNSQQTTEQISRLDAASGTFVPIPVEIGPEGDAVFLVLYGTGVRNREQNGSLNVTIGGGKVDVPYAGRASLFIGLDQVNIGPLARALAGRGEVEVTLNVDGKEANRLKVVFK